MCFVFRGTWFKFTRANYYFLNGRDSDEILIFAIMLCPILQLLHCEFRRIGDSRETADSLKGTLRKKGRPIMPFLTFIFGSLLNNRNHTYSAALLAFSLYSATSLAFSLYNVALLAFSLYSATLLAFSLYSATSHLHSPSTTLRHTCILPLQRSVTLAFSLYNVASHLHSPSTALRHEESGTLSVIYKFLCNFISSCTDLKATSIVMCL